MGGQCLPKRFFNKGFSVNTGLPGCEATGREVAALTFALKAASPVHVALSLLPEEAAGTRRRVESLRPS